MRTCPYCGKKVRTVGAVRPNKFGDMTGYVFCKNCNIRMHVFLDIEKDKIIMEIPYQNRWPLKDLLAQEACRNAIKNAKVVLNLRQKKKEDTGIVIDISNIEKPALTMEELQQRLDSILKGV